MNKYAELRANFLRDHAHADEIIYRDDESRTPVQAIYYAPDPNADYEGVDEILAKANEKQYTEADIHGHGSDMWNEK